MRSRWYILLAGIAALQSCNDGRSKSHGPIVLGDSTTIVTEKDSLYLKDPVTDFKPTIPETTDQPDTSAQATPPADTTKKADAPKQDPPANATNEKGLSVAFSEATILIPNIVTKSYRNQDPKKGNGVSYQLVSGNLNNNQIKVTAGNVTKVWMHYQTIVVLKNSLGALQLDALSNTTEWEELSGKGNVYNMSSLDARHLEHSDAGAAEIRKAIERALKAHHIHRRKHAEWLSSVRRVRNVNQAPLKVVLYNVVWKIEGKDAKGKAYQKQLRIDIP